MLRRYFRIESPYIGSGVQANKILVWVVIGSKFEWEAHHKEEKIMGNDNNIVLIGMPGVGKSTIGVVLAKILNYEFVDVDLLIQRRFDRTLQKLIDSLGPFGFIEVENEVLKGLSFENTIISTGGSAVYSDEAMEHLAKIAKIVYLKVSLEELDSRLTDFSERGVVMRGIDTPNLVALYNERAPLYERYAQYTVDLDGLSITDAAKAIIDELSL